MTTFDLVITPPFVNDQVTIENAIETGAMAGAVLRSGPDGTFVR